MAEFNLTPSSQNTPSPNPAAKQSLGVHPSLPSTTGPSTGPTVLTADLTASSSVPGPVLAHIQALESQIQALTSAHQADQGLRDELADIKRLLLLTTSHSAGGEAGGGGGKDRTQASVSGDKHQKQLATRGKVHHWFGLPRCGSTQRGRWAQEALTKSNPCAPRWTQATDDP